MISKGFFYTKIVFILISFSLTLYIMLLRMDYFGNNIISLAPMFIPLLLVLTVFVFSFFLNKGTNNLFFNLGSTLALLAIVIIDLRAIFDKNTISVTTALVNFNFFDMQSVKIMIMLYLIFIGNVFLIFLDKKEKIHS